MPRAREIRANGALERPAGTGQHGVVLVDRARVPLFPFEQAEADVRESSDQEQELVEAARAWRPKESATPGRSTPRKSAHRW